MVLFKGTGTSFAGGSNRKGGGFAVTFYGVDALQEALDGMKNELWWSDEKDNWVPRRTAANREMREGAKDIAERILLPQMKRTARSAPVPIARAMAETARAKSDRMVMVQVGGVNPPLSGFKRGRGVKRAKGRKTTTGRDATSQNYRTTLAWGSEFGPLASVNHYKVPRRFPQGYWVLPAVEDSWARVVEKWENVLLGVIDKYADRRP